MKDVECWDIQERKTPARAAVYQNVRRRMRNLCEVKKLSKPSLVLQELSVEDVRKLGQQQYLPPSSFRLEAASDQVIEQESKQAQEWLISLLASHKKFLGREHRVRMFRSAVEKELAGAMGEWSDMEKLYMVLTNFDCPGPVQRLMAALTLVLHLDFAETLGAMGKLGSQRREAKESALVRDAEMMTTRVKIVERTRDIKVDHFACATPLLSLKLRPDIVDDNEGCCPICQNSYTDLSANTARDLLSDFPVRIKYCGHVIGKACLEKWMDTPKIDMAKYPHRTCPLCRVKIEGIQGPPIPAGLRLHLKDDRRAMETLRDLVYGWDMEISECLDTVAACMSVEIACKEVLTIIEQQKGKTRSGYEEDEKMLKEKMEEMKKEKWAWGFRGDHVWRQLRDEWMNSGVMQKE